MNDPHRPSYHFLPPANWMNDPNGVIQWKGVYHLFYQYNPHGAFHGTIHWGHATSTDLVHWTHLPIALLPTPGSPDAEGCWSGCTVDNNGTPTIIYTGWDGKQEHPCLATSTDDLLTLQKYPRNPVIDGPPPGMEVTGFRDHCIWKEEDTWYQLIGSGMQDVGGFALLYRSVDLLSWEYMHPLVLADESVMPQPATDIMWECPDLFTLDLPVSQEVRHVLALSVMDTTPAWYPAYFTGVYSTSDHRFRAEQFHKLDYGPSFYAPQSFRDDSGRRIMWGWLREGRDEQAQRDAGWSGVMALPRVLSLRPDGTLEVYPALEIELLRGRHMSTNSAGVTQITPDDGIGWRTDTMEIIVEFEQGDAAEVGIAVRCSPDGSEQTQIFYSRAKQQLVLDTTRSSLDSTAHKGRYSGPLLLAQGETLRLHIFLDRSVVEVFGNERCCIAGRIYPSRSDSMGVSIIANGGRTRLLSLDSWEMQSIWTV